VLGISAAFISAVIAVDLRGLGDSDSGTLPNDVPTSADDLHGLVAELGLGPVLLVGQDWGGSTAFAFAAAHPDEVRRLAVVEAMPAGPWTDPESGRSGLWFAQFHQIPDLPERMVAGRERVYLDWFFREFSATPGAPTPAAVDEYVRCYARSGAMASVPCVVCDLAAGTAIAVEGFSGGHMALSTRFGQSSGMPAMVT
jgi:pimeloyl-ACP methyl ester carboxylesterase